MAFDTNALLPLPHPPADWTPLRLRSTSAPISRSSGPKGKLGKNAKGNSPHRGAITPPTTTAGSSQNSSPARTPRDGSLSPEHAPTEADISPSPFDLPTLLPSPSTLLSMKTPKGFSSFEYSQYTFESSFDDS